MDKSILFSLGSQTSDYFQFVADIKEISEILAKEFNKSDIKAVIVTLIK